MYSFLQIQCLENNFGDTDGPGRFEMYDLRKNLRRQSSDEIVKEETCECVRLCEVRMQSLK